ncbi:hypothetical protein ARMGADRAFT_1035686 [Armillaria gallica]|uniref:Uncharacterized protein n=1 Tax=Armillaria gallica TaxID=47427 RepID=A0A2H3D4A5_ARMGA|nr:hypothetical protein ARMGADRAFT_1035686 [Armillaria gallica]
MVIKPAIADKYNLWAAGDEVTPTSMPVKRAIRRKKGNPIPMESIGDSKSKKLSPPNVKERQKWVHSDIMPSICERWFNAIPDLIEKGGTYIEGQAQLGKLEHWVETCNIPRLRSEILTRPNFAFASQTRGHIYVN